MFLLKDKMKKYEKLKVGQRVFILCARTDEYGGNDTAIDSSTFGWITAFVVKSVPATNTGTTEVEIEEEQDKYTTSYDRRFILTEQEIAKTIMTSLPSPT